ncbi:response regulator transcription factor [Cupriavidus numazuensis]|uniref:Transcriptional regulatory protein RcsB n=1 Tax=Cupriavidus numazuensis TaxID=221992 RepID=A0ABN7Q9F3_9BURK|nr:response regulator transcription factor [Cupriavidus numazuensis]CAG2158957.1 Transcriptional regulatory protein RcsB [Cupriavidus numazuensis]
MAIRVILADDHPLIIFGVRQALASATGIRVVADAPDPGALTELLRNVPCDVLVTDFSMPCGTTPDGLAMLTGIRTRFPHVRVVVLTMLENPGLMVSMQDVGVLGIVNKRDDLSELPAVIAAAYRRRRLLSTSVREDLRQWEHQMSQKHAARQLSPRETEVVRMYVNGMSTSEMARHLHRSINTISTQKTNAMRKLGVSNDAELFDYAQAHGLKS